MNFESLIKYIYKSERTLAYSFIYNRLFLFEKYISKLIYSLILYIFIFRSFTMIKNNIFLIIVFNEFRKQICD